MRCHFGPTQHLLSPECPLECLSSLVSGDVVCVCVFGICTTAIWPVYGLLTPLMLLVLFIGFIFSTNFVPHFG